MRAPAKSTPRGSNRREFIPLLCPLPTKQNALTYYHLVRKYCKSSKGMKDERVQGVRKVNETLNTDSAAIVPPPLPYHFINQIEM